MAGSVLDTALKGFLERFKEDLTEEEVQEFSLTSREDLNKALARIQSQQAKDKRLRNLKRIQGFLEAFDQYGKVLELFANTSDFVPFVYGPIKFMILMASNYAEALDILLDAYKQIGENFPLLRQYEDLFRQNPRMREVLELLYGDILVFHREALGWFRRQNGWKKFLQCTWKTFRTTFDGILKNIRDHRELLQTQATVAQFSDFRKSREEAQQRWRQWREAEDEKQRLKVREWLSDGSDYAQHQDDLIDRWEPYAGTGEWLFDRGEFRQWCDPDQCLHPLMWLHGQPGAGKTILASKTIARLQEFSFGQVLYFYFTHGNDLRNSLKTMAKSLLAQMLKYNRMLVPYLYEKSCTEGMERLRQSGLCKDLIIALESMPRTYVVLDGLDECPAEEEKTIIKFFKDFIKSRQDPEKDNIRVLLVGQNDNISAGMLQKEFTLVIEQEDNLEDIITYTAARTLEIQTKFNIEETDGVWLASQIRSHAKGMFLYAKLVLDNLYCQGNRERLYREMEPQWFPKGIQQAYERIKQRIFDESLEPLHDNIWKILGLLVFAKRTFKWNEIQGAFAICVKENNIRFEDRLLVSSAKELCSSLVEVRTNDSVELVHTTAKKYLLSHEEIHPGNQQYELASLCLVMLNSENFNDEATDIEMAESISRGNFAFLDYAMMYWACHVEDFVLGKYENADGDHSKRLQTLLEDFLDIHSESSEKINVMETIVDKTRRNLCSWHEWPRLEELIAAIASNKWQKDTYNSASAENETLDLAKLLSRARGQLENLSGSSNVTMNKAYGSKLFKCPRMNCGKFSDGYTSNTARDQHQVKEHERPFC